MDRKDFPTIPQWPKIQCFMIVIVTNKEKVT